jgi:hypothetical protein
VSNGTVSDTINDYGGTITPAAGQLWGRIYIWNYQPNFTNTIIIDSVRLTPSSLAVALDTAENFPVQGADKPQAGELVTLGNPSGHETAYVVPSREAYDQNILGVVSTKPAETLDDGKDYPKAPVALTGRVPVKVSTQNGPIGIGDYLTSSPLPGVAMKSTKPGRVIGKALEAYATTDPQATSTITVFLNPTWYDPDLALTDTGDLEITKTPTGTYQLTNNGSVVDRIGAFGQVVTAYVHAGYIQAQKFTVDGVDINDTLNELTDTFNKQQQTITELQQEITTLQTAACVPK